MLSSRLVLTLGQRRGALALHVWSVSPSDAMLVMGKMLCTKKCFSSQCLKIAYPAIDSEMMSSEMFSSNGAF